MNALVSRVKFLSFTFIALIYAAGAIFLLSRIKPGEGLYESWDTSRYLVLYFMLSFAYFIWIAKLLKVNVLSLLPVGIVALILFSLLFSLIRQSSSLLGLFPGFKIQKAYFLTFFLILSYAIFYNVIKIVYSTIRSFRESRIRPSVLYYLALPYITLLPFFVYMLVKDCRSIHIAIALAVTGLYSLGTLLLRNDRVKGSLRRLLGFLWDAKHFIILIFIFALAVRALFAIQLTRHLPPGVMGGPDSLAISEEAKRISETWNMFEKGNTFLSQKGSAVIFYALIYKAFGYNPFVARLFNALLGALAVVLTFYIAKLIFGSTAAKIAAFLNAGYGYLIQYGSYIGTEALGLFSIELFILGIIIAKEEDRRVFSFWSFIAGLGLAICILARAEYYHALLVIFLWVFYVFRRKKTNILYFFAGFIVIAAPWIYRNFLIFGEFTMSFLLTSEFTKGWLGSHLWHYEITKFAQAGLPVNSFSDMFLHAVRYPVLSAGIILPHILKGIYNFWDYNFFFSPAFIFIEPKNSYYNLILCFYLYSFMVLGFIVSRKKWDITLMLLFLIIFKTITYVFTTTPTFPEGERYIPLFKDWYRFTIVSFTHILMGGGAAYILAKAAETYNNIRRISR